MEVALRNLEPGSLVRIPETLKTAAGDAQVGVFIGGEYVPGAAKVIFPYVEALVGQEFQRNALPARVEDEKWEVVADDTVLNQFRNRPLSVPFLDIQCGTDPEIFCTEANENAVIPAWNYLLSEPEADHWYSMIDEEDPKRFWDGVQAEWCPVPSRLPNVLLEGVHNGMRQIRIAARKNHPDAQLSIRSTATLSEDQMKAANPMHLAFRCSASHNVYGDPGNDPPDTRFFRERYAGGHLHGGSTRKFTVPVITQVVKALDGVVGLTGVSLAAGMDDPRRRRYYGRAGEFRLPSHGLEYRVLSNFWLCSPAIADLVMHLFQQVIPFGAHGFYKVCWQADQDRVREIINNCDVAGAREILGANRGILAYLLAKCFQPKAAAFAIETILNGVGFAIENPSDLMKNWHLEDNKWEKFAKHPGGGWESHISNQLYPARSVEGQVGRSA